MANLEVACFSAEDAKTALELGADRIEFCSDYEVGGITPSLSDFILLRSNFPEAAIHVMIRPRSGNFHYSDFKIEGMLEDADKFLQAGANGLVFGFLTPKNTVDRVNCEKMIRLIRNYPNAQAIFHRAIDETADYDVAIEQLTTLGFDSVLSSGKQANALAGKDVLTKANVLYDGILDVMPGGGIRTSNILELSSIRANWYHSACWNPETKCLDPKELSNLIALVKSF